MANTNRKGLGFRPVKKLGGGSWSVNKYFSTSDNLFLGDIVEKDATSVAYQSGAHPGCARAEADDIPLGVVVGWEVNPAALGNLYHAASSTYGVFICDDPYVIMEAQDDLAGLAATDVGLNVDFVVAAGTTATGASNMEIDSGTEATTADEPLKIMEVINRPDNDITGANAKILVMFNQHAYKSDAGTAGI